MVAKVAGRFRKRAAERQGGGDLLFQGGRQEVKKEKKMRKGGADNGQASTWKEIGGRSSDREERIPTERRNGETRGARAICESDDGGGASSSEGTLKEEIRKVAKKVLDGKGFFNWRAGLHFHAQRNLGKVWEEKRRGGRADNARA